MSALCIHTQSTYVRPCIHIQSTYDHTSALVYRRTDKTHRNSVFRIRNVYGVVFARLFWVRPVVDADYIPLYNAAGELPLPLPTPNPNTSASFHPNHISQPKQKSIHLFNPLYVFYPTLTPTLTPTLIYLVYLVCI